MCSKRTEPPHSAAASDSPGATAKPVPVGPAHYKVGDRAEIFMTPDLLGRMEGEALAQLTNTSKQPGIRRTLLMPDGHVGYGCPVGTVAIAEDWIYPPLAGFDIGCFTADTLVPTVDGQSQVQALTVRSDPR